MPIRPRLNRARHWLVVGGISEQRREDARRPDRQPPLHLDTSLPLRELGGGEDHTMLIRTTS
jgi:hypothetical protein